MAALLYAADNNGQFPRTRYDPADPTPRFFTNPLGNDPFGADGPEPNDVTAAWYLLLRHTDLTAEQFLCPLTEHGGPLKYSDFTGRDDKRSMSNFPDRRFIGYSFANPYPLAELSDWDWSTRRSSTFALAADINPGVAELLTTPVTADMKTMRKLNTPNHRGEGQNVLFADGSVRYVNTPFEGPVRDNIYTAGGPPDVSAASDGVAIVSPPVTSNDSVLLPVVSGEPVRARLPRSEATRRFWLGIVLPTTALLGLLIGFVVVYANRSRQRKLERGELPEIPT